MSLDEVRRLALSLPEAIEADHHGFPSIRVGGKIFYTFRPETGRLMVKLDAEDQHNFCEAPPTTIEPVPGYWGRKGSTFIDCDNLDATVIESLLKIAWRRVAPKRLRDA